MSKNSADYSTCIYLHKTNIIFLGQAITVIFCAKIDYNGQRAQRTFELKYVVKSTHKQTDR